MARSPRPTLSSIYGIPDSWREKPYNDLNEVLNKIGVMAKRFELPFARITHLSRKKEYCYEHFSGYAYVVPKNWRDCLYEDLETGDYYIISPHPENEKHNPEYTYCWIAFKLSGITDGIVHYRRDDSGKIIKEISHHSGSFIDLMWRCSLNEILDTLAINQKPIVIKLINRLYGLSNDQVGEICQFDI